MKLAACVMFGCLAWAADPVEIRVIYDNTVASPACEKGWGFAALVRSGGRALLFDAGADPRIFMRNFDAMKIDASSFDRMLVSHRHGDHTGGIAPLQERNPKLKVLWPDPPEAYEILPGFYSTGTLPGPTPEQALAVETPAGLVIVTGCSHPGVVNLVEAAMKQRKVRGVRFLIGGFHMLQQSPEQISGTIAALKKLGVERIAATHCTGETAIKMFREAFGAQFEPAGAGKTIVIE
jgi:7,8-dihydropterin-6-yl-methyl-4-(beta-D-ribofuranosyl)aminobenzene 5'-phosphate synthase